MLTREYLDEYRHVPRVIKEGFFSKPKVVFILQQAYKDTGTYYSPSDYTCSGREVEYSGWVDCEVLPTRGINNK